MPFSAGVPAVPIRDLQVHRRDADLVLGTHGRAIIVIDDVRPLRELAAAPEIHGRAVHAFSPPPAIRAEIAEAIGYRSTGHAMQQGETRPEGALLTWWSAEAGRSRLEISDASGTVLFTRSVGADAGLNRTSWDLQPGGDIGDDVARRIMVAPGTYTYSVTAGGETSTAELRIDADPRSRFSAADHAARVAIMVEHQGIARRVDEARRDLADVADGVEIVLRTLDADQQALREQGEALRDTIQNLMERHFTGPECQGGCRGRVTVQAVQAPAGRIASDDGPPSENTRVMMEQARAAADAITGDIDRIMSAQVEGYRTALRAAGYTPFGERR
jgi:hypothetical protein